MISEFRAKNFGCLRDLTLQLTPFHAFIGPNDSGKSTILRALRTLGEFASGSVSGATFDAGIPRNATEAEPVVEFATTSSAGKYRVWIDATGLHHQLETPGATNEHSGGWAWNSPPRTDLWRPASESIAGARMVRFDPDALRRPSALVPRDNAVGFLNERGYGLPGVLQAIQGRYFDAFQELNEQVRLNFPTTRYVQIVPVSESQLVIEVELVDATRVPAAQVSEGLLYYLAFSSVPFLVRAPLVLVEEPENGLHPSRIATIVKMLREFGKKTNTQIVLATHSPLVINELQPEEVTIVTRPSAQSGSVATRMHQTQNFEKRRDVYALGELWLSYADGNLESELVAAQKE